MTIVLLTLTDYHNARTTTVTHQWQGDIEIALSIPRCKHNILLCLYTYYVQIFVNLLGWFLTLDYLLFTTSFLTNTCFVCACVCLCYISVKECEQYCCSSECNPVKLQARDIFF